MWLGIAFLTCFAIVLELAHRAPEMEETPSGLRHVADAADGY
jgi:hypothetical protein